MKVEIWTPNFEYSCQFCWKTFKTRLEEKIILGSSPLCSYKCLFNVVYHILKKYTPNQLACLREVFNIHLPEEKLVFELTRIILKEVLIQEVHDVQNISLDKADNNTYF